MGGLHYESPLEFKEKVLDSSGELSEVKLKRVSYMLGIQKALLNLFKDSNQAYSWIDRPNELAPFCLKRQKPFCLKGQLTTSSSLDNFWTDGTASFMGFDG